MPRRLLLVVLCWPFVGSCAQVFARPRAIAHDATPAELHAWCTIDSVRRAFQLLPKGSGRIIGSQF